MSTKMTLEEQLGDWYKTVLKHEFTKVYMKRLSAALRVERLKYTIRPDSKDVFRAYRLTRLSDIKVVIVGQDPYPHKAANGLAFSCYESLEKIPASLQSIFKEVDDDIKFQPYHNPDLARWAKQGVMLLNTCLTTRDGFAGSHSDLGWQQFTSKTLELICKKETPVVFLLWGRDAQRLGHKIPEPHQVFHSAHPSPMSAYRGFFGSKPFSRTNEFLREHGMPEIDWLNNDI